VALLGEEGARPDADTRRNDPQQIHDFALAEVTCRVDLCEVDDEDFLERGGGALVVVPLDDQEQVLLHHRQIANRERCIVEPRPRAPCVVARRDVEFTDSMSKSPPVSHRFCWMRGSTGMVEPE
jgi:hypothetical protein